MYSRIIMLKIQGRNALKRIVSALLTVRRVPAINVMPGFDDHLVYMYIRFTEHLEKYPVPGSAEAVAEAKANMPSIKLPRYRVCEALAAISVSNFDMMIRRLSKYHNTTLEESYFKIQCGPYDILQIVIDKAS